MKRIVTGINGGFPFVQDDLGYVQGAYEEAFKGLMTIYGVDPGDHIILSGIEKISNPGAGTWDFSEGWVVLAGEICYFPAQSVTNVAANKQWFSKETIYDPAGSKNFETSGVNDTYQNVRAKINTGLITPPGVSRYSDVPRLIDYIRSSVHAKAWIPFPDGDDDAYYGAGLTPAESIRQYYKDVDGFVHLKGEKVIDNIVVPTTMNIATLPVGYRPASTIRYLYTRILGDTTANFFEVEISTAGLIRVMFVHGNFMLKLHEIVPFRAV